MTLFLGLVISLPLLAYVLFPLFDPAFKPVGRRGDEAERLRAERDRYYEAIADLDFEYECGKLSEEDYRRLRERLMAELSALLKRLDEVERL